MKRKLCVLLITLTVGLMFKAWSQPGWYLSADFGQGQTLRHRSTMVFELPRPALAGSLELLRASNGSRDWESVMQLPRWGVSFQWQDFGNRAELGYVYGVTPFFELPIIHRPRLQLWGRMTMGFAYVDRHYDRQLNPINNAIGSALNNYTSFGLIAETPLTKRLNLRFSGYFVHQSNARAQLPNLGLNVPQWRAGLSYRLSKEESTEVRPKSELRFDRRLRYYLRVGLTQVEDKVSDGPKYPVWVVSAFVAERVTPVQRLMLGIELSYDASIRAFMLNQDIPRGFPGWDPLRPAIWAGYELGSERFAMMGQVFVYAHDWPGSYGRQFWGTKFGPTYYFKFGEGEHFQPFLGIYLKTHLFIADYFESSLGIRF